MQGTNHTVIDLELMVRQAHSLYMVAPKANRSRSIALLALTVAAELYRYYGPTCTEVEYQERVRTK